MQRIQLTDGLNMIVNQLCDARENNDLYKTTKLNDLKGMLSKLTKIKLKQERNDVIPWVWVLCSSLTGTNTHPQETYIFS